MVHDMDKEVYKVCSCPRIKSYMHCTHIRKGMWVVGGEAISYSLLFEILKRASSHKPTSVWSFFPMHILYSVTVSIVALYSISFVSGCPQVFKRWYCQSMVSEYCGLSRPFFQRRWNCPFLYQTKSQEKLGSTPKCFFEKQSTSSKQYVHLL